MGTCIIHTRALHADDAGSVVKLGYKALTEQGNITVDYNETHFQTFVKRTLIHPNYKGSVGLFANDQLIGFAIILHNSFAWAPQRRIATLEYYYILPEHINDQNSVALFTALENWCKQNGINNLRISNVNIADVSLLKLGFTPEERIFSKDYD